MCYRDGSVHVPVTVGFSDKVQMEVIIIIITSLSSAGVFNAARALSADRRFNAFLLLLA